MRQAREVILAIFEPMTLKPLVSWVKSNKLAALIILVLSVLLYSVLNTPSGISPVTDGVGGIPELGEGTTVDGKGGTETSGDRVVIEESALSLVVSDVSKTAVEVVSYAEKEGGFLVSSEITSPEESPVATVTVRVPSKKLRTAIEYYRTLAVKVASETIEGVDVTDEFEDLDARIETLEGTIVQFEAIKAKATKIADLVSITQQIITLRGQIDELKGTKKFIADSAAYPKITASLATDEFALPYQPSEGFRPGVIFKQAVRALLASVYAVAGALIWIGVYAVVVVPVLLLVRYLLKRFKIL
jgi:hypothetical protein